MNSIDRNDSWNSDNDFLSGALRGAADEMPGGEVDDLHVSFGVVRDRVRRRRVAKVGGLAGVSLVLVGGIAFGATQTSLLERDGVVAPGASQGGFTGPETPAGPTPDTTVDGPSGPPARDNIEFGYQPSWLEWSDLTCGMPVADLTTTAPGWSVSAAGDIYSLTSDFDGETTSSRGMAATVEQGEGSLDVAPVLVWSQGGVVVDLGPNVFEAPGPQRAPLLGGPDTAVEAQGGARQTCLPTSTETRPVYEAASPEGDYEVRVVAFPQVASGERATVVSAPVAVRIDADGVHTATGTRGGAATIEPPAVATGEISRFELDRTTAWVAAEMTHRDYTSDAAMAVVGRCDSSDPADTVPVEVLVPSTGAVLATSDVTCDGQEHRTTVGVLAGGGEVADIRPAGVPDGVSRLWATVVPQGAGADTATGECSADGLDMEYDPAGSPAEGAGETARAVVEAARACDAEALIALANESSTELMYGTETPEQTFGLPEGDAEHYRTLVRLLAGTRGATDGGDPGNPTIVWPRVASAEFRDSDEAWAEVVEAGLLTQADAEAQRADETFGYTGMAVGIAEDGTWRYYSSSD